MSKMEFTADEDFEALNKAKCYCQENGYSVGTLQRGEPIGILKGEFFIAKWRNLSREERRSLSGVLTAPGNTFRQGPVRLEIYED